MQIMDGRACSSRLKEEVKDAVSLFVESQGRPPGLAVILVGDNPSSQVYIKHKINACEHVGIYSEKHQLSADSTEDEVAKVIEKLNNQKAVDGILLQLPLPKNLNSKKLPALSRNVNQPAILPT